MSEHERVGFRDLEGAGLISAITASKLNATESDGLSVRRNILAI
jgi:hypothetical protein